MSFKATNDTWDVLYEVAGQVVRLKMKDLVFLKFDFQNSGVLGGFPPPVAAKNAFFPNQGVSQFAHRKCIQRWCNKKGNTICEICNQAFSPNYSLPPVRSNAIMAIDIRQEWGHNADLHVALASAEQQLLQTEYEDYAMSQTSSIACLRSVTLILLMILLVRQALILTKNSVTGQDASIIFNFEMSVLQFVGVLLPCFAMARSWYAIQNQRRRQG